MYLREKERDVIFLRGDKKNCDESFLRDARNFFSFCCCNMSRDFRLFFLLLLLLLLLLVFDFFVFFVLFVLFVFSFLFLSVFLSDSW